MKAGQHMQHHLKVWPEYYTDLETNRKPFEVRKDDRGFEIGDTLILELYDPDSEKYLGRKQIRKITYILRGGQFGIEEDYCVMAIQKA